MANKTTEIQNVRPSLKVPYSTKVKNDFSHTKDLMNYYIGSSTFVDEESVGLNKGSRDVRLFYLAYNLQLPESYFHQVTNPLNSTNPNYRNWPGRIRNYSIIRPNIDLLEGEYEKRPFSFTIKVNNPDAVNIAQDKEYQALLSTLEQMFINEINQRGQDSGVPTQEVELPPKIKAKFQSTYRDERAIMGEAALNILMDDLALEELFKKLFKDWLIAGETYSYKGMRGKDLIIERVSPLDIDFDKAPDTDYVEDGQWVVRRFYMTVADVIDNWHDELKEKELIKLNENVGDYSFKTSGFANTGGIREEDDLKRSKIVVYHVCFKYQTKIGILSYPNPMTGEMEEIEVPDTFVPDTAAGESVEWFWYNEVWEGYKIGLGADDIYVGIQPLEMQRNKINNHSKCKLPYNGKKFSDLHAQNLSVVEMGMPYEIMYRILHFKLEMTIAKSKGKILLLDKNVIPKGQGWTDEKFFYWSEANGWGLIDRTQVGADRSFNQYQVVDLSLYEHIANLIELMQMFKEEWDDLLGISRQRKGKTEASETATGVQSAVYNSSVISERTFSRFDEFVQRELAGLLDYSKLAWREGHKRLWFSDDTRNTMLDIDPVKFSETEYGVFVSRSPRDLQNLELVRSQIQAFAQNNMAPSTVVDVVRARSLSRLHQILKEKEAESIQAQMEAQRQQQLTEAEVGERLEMIKGQFLELEGIIKERLIHVEYDRKEDVEMLKLTGVDQTPLPTSDPLQAQKLQQDAGFKAAELNLKQQSENNKQRAEARKANQEDKKLQFKEKELKVKKQIADKQASVALKNKTSGEK